ncbi:hypothetical protein Bpfe_015818, partial [Biomphalaria pfeifferi]
NHGAEDIEINYRKFPYRLAAYGADGIKVSTLCDQRLARLSSGKRGRYCHVASTMI